MMTSQPAANPPEPTAPNLTALVAEAKRLRAEKRLTLEVIAERAGMTVNGAGNLFRGARRQPGVLVAGHRSSS
jgi:hypothetical protein